MSKKRGRQMLRTIVITVGVAVAYAVVFVSQMLLEFGPVGSTAGETPGSPAWFAAGSRAVAFESFVFWPVLIAVGALLQRFWCRDSPLWFASLVALPGIVAHAPHVKDVALAGLAYIAVALLVGAAADAFRKHRHPQQAA
jgi:hypothetical protein